MDAATAFSMNCRVFDGNLSPSSLPGSDGDDATFATFWAEFAFAKSVFYTGVGWRDDAMTWRFAAGGKFVTSQMQQKIDDALAAPTEGASDEDDRARCAVVSHLERLVATPAAGASIKAVCAIALRTITGKDKETPALLAESLLNHKECILAACSLGCVADLFASIADLPPKTFPVVDAGLRMEEAWQNLAAPLTRDAAFRKVVKADAARWLCAGGKAPWPTAPKPPSLEEQVEVLKSALDTVHERADGLTSVLHAAGLTENGQRVALATVYEGETRIAADSLAVRAAAPPPPPPPLPPSSPPVAAMRTVYLAWLPHEDRMKRGATRGDPWRPVSAEALNEAMSVLVAFDVRDARAEAWPEFHSSCRVVRDALNWLGWRISTEKCKRLSDRNSWHQLMVAASTLVELAQPVCESVQRSNAATGKAVHLADQVLRAARGLDVPMKRATTKKARSHRT